MTFSYDDDADVLYVTFVEHNGPVVYLENESGDILRIAEGTGNIVGCTIPYFMRRSRTGTITVPEIGVVPFNQIATQLLNERKEKRH